MHKCNLWNVLSYQFKFGFRKSTHFPWRDLHLRNPFHVWIMWSNNAEKCLNVFLILLHTKIFLQTRRKTLSVLKSMSKHRAPPQGKDFTIRLCTQNPWPGHCSRRPSNQSNYLLKQRIINNFKICFFSLLTQLLCQQICIRSIESVFSQALKALMRSLGGTVQAGLKTQRSQVWSEAGATEKVGNYRVTGPLLSLCPLAKHLITTFYCTFVIVFQARTPIYDDVWNI